MRKKDPSPSTLVSSSFTTSREPGKGISVSAKSAENYQQLADSRANRSLEMLQSQQVQSHEDPTQLLRPNANPPGEREVLQGYFVYPNQREFELVREYVRQNMAPMVRAAFNLTEESGTAVYLYDFLEENFTSIHDVYDWDDARSGAAFPVDIDYGLSGASASGDQEVKHKEKASAPASSAKRVMSRPLRIGDEDVRGTEDLLSDSDEALQEFDTGLSEADFGIQELQELHLMLQKRRAPLDRRRREIVERYLLDPETGSFQEDVDLEFDRYSDFSDGTDGLLSDLEDEDQYLDDETRQKQAQSRMSRAKVVQKPRLFQDRLKKVAGAGDSKMDEVVFKKKKGVPKVKKGNVYRKDTAFNLPSTTVRDRAILPVKPTKKQTEDLATLNALLQLGVPIQVAENLVDSKFVVAQYRGLFYSRGGFDHAARERHRSIDERGRPVFSSAALEESPYGLSGYYYLYGIQAREEDLAALQSQTAVQAREIGQKLLDLREQETTSEEKQAVGRNMDQSQASRRSDILTHLYTEDYDRFHAILAKVAAGDTSDPLSSLFIGLPNSANPKVSTGDVPTHAARYAFGLKPYAGHESEILEPQYGPSGKPLHPYSGKIYTSIHPLGDYEAGIAPSSIVDMQKAKKVNVSQVILPEHEAQFEAMISEDRVADHFVAKFPDFSGPYLEVFQDRYGIDRELFLAFRGAFAKVKPGTAPFVFVESLLSNYLAQYSELRAIDAAVAAAAAKGATLVYRVGHRQFGFSPPALRDTGSSAAPSVAHASTASSSSSEPSYKPTFVVDLLKKFESGDVEVTSGRGGGGMNQGGDHKETAVSGSATPSLAVASSASHAKAAPSAKGSARPTNTELLQELDLRFGGVIRIGGSNTACYIRALVTAASRIHQLIDASQIENMVNALQDHLSFVNLRDRGQMINAGGLVAAEVRNALSQLLGRVYDPMVHVVMVDPNTGQLTDFTVNVGTHHVWLAYTPGHFDLINYAAAQARP